MEAMARDREQRLASTPKPGRGDVGPGVRLRCPRCSANLTSLNCTKCGFELWERAGILHTLPPARAHHYAQFISNHEQLRAKEALSGAKEEFYIELPFRDTSGQNSAEWHAKARTYLHLLDHVLKPAVPLAGKILDLGAGNCWLSFRLALEGYKPFAVDLLTNRFDGLGAAENYQRCLSGLFPRIQAELAHLPFQDEQADAAIFNASFHYAENDVAAASEALRCVKPGGLIAITDTPWYSSQESGRRMLLERGANCRNQSGIASSSIDSIGFLTDERLRALEERLAIRWTVLTPRYGVARAVRPFIAQLRGHREPARFRIYVARKAQQ